MPAPARRDMDPKGIGRDACEGASSTGAANTASRPGVNAGEPSAARTGTGTPSRYVRPPAIVGSWRRASRTPRHSDIWTGPRGRWEASNTDRSEVTGWRLPVTHRAAGVSQRRCEEEDQDTPIRTPRRSSPLRAHRSDTRYGMGRRRPRGRRRGRSRCDGTQGTRWCRRTSRRGLAHSLPRPLRVPVGE